MDRSSTCPGCRQVSAGPTCPTCGIRSDAPQADRLREIAAEYDGLVARHDALTAELEGLARQRDSLERERWALIREAAPSRLAVRERHRPAVAPPPLSGRTPDPRPVGRVAPAAPRIEVDAIPLRNLLLATGAALLGLAAVIFAFIAWPRLGEGGQALVLLATTVIAAGTAWLLHRRLPATAEALIAVTIALVLVDAYALREVGVGADLAASLYWSFVMAVLSLSAAWVGRLSRVAQVASAVAGPMAAVLAADSVADGPLAWSAYLSVIAAGTVTAALLLNSTPWPRRALPARVLAAAAFALWVTAALLSLDGGTSQASTAAVLALLSLAPLVVALAGPAEDGLREWRTWAALGTSLPLLAAIGVASAALGAGTWVPVTVGAAAALCSAAALVRTDPRLFAAGMSGLTVLAGAVLYFGDSIATAVSAPLGWLERPWALRPSDPARLPFEIRDTLQAPETLAILVLGATVALAASAARRGHLEGRISAAVAGGLAASAGAVVVRATDMSLWAAMGSMSVGMAITLGFAGVADRKAGHSVVIGIWAAAAVFAVPALGWTASSRGLTPALPTLLAMGSGAALAAARSDWLRQANFAISAAALMAIPPAVAAAVITTDTAPAAGLALTVSAAAVLIVGSIGRGGAVVGTGFVEALGIAGLAVGVSMSGDDQLAFASALTLSTVGVMAAGGLPRDRRDPYLVLGAVMAVLSSWAWLALADVELPEAYVGPAAAVALLMGLEARKRGLGESSWATLSPGLLIGFVPILFVALAEGGWVRPVLLAAAAVATVIVGARARLQAPLAIGSAVIVTLGVDAIAPVLGEVPRWASIGVAGLVLLWLGATAEHRLDNLRTWQSRYEALEPK